MRRILTRLLPAIVVMAVQTSGHHCAGGHCLLYPGVCLVAGLTGAVGCLLYGLIGFGGMAVGLLLGAAPALVARRA